MIVIAIVGGVIVFLLLAHAFITAPYQDETTGRLYRHMRNPAKQNEYLTDTCPICGRIATRIYCITKKKLQGVYCLWHGEIWDDRRGE